MNPPVNSAGGKRCPICGKGADGTFRPFCSKRCAEVDLHRWLSGTYAIPAADEDQEEDTPPRAPLAPE
jgi:endogenous inhibitor of DNA gyrase (YacG/DUF329 family)